LVRIGGHSLGVIIPPSWLRYYRLQRGDVVEIISDDDLIIRPAAEKGGKPKGNSLHRRDAGGEGVGPEARRGHGVSVSEYLRRLVLDPDRRNLFTPRLGGRDRGS